MTCVMTSVEYTSYIYTTVRYAWDAEHGASGPFHELRRLTRARAFHMSTAKPLHDGHLLRSPHICPQPALFRLII